MATYVKSLTFVKGFNTAGSVGNPTEADLSLSRLIGASATPAVATVAAGAGANASASVAGNDMAGAITLTQDMADTPSANSDILTLTFATTFAAAPRVLLMPANDAAWALAYSVVVLRQGDVTTTTFTIRSGSTPLPPTTAATYEFNYQVIQ